MLAVDPLGAGVGVPLGGGLEVGVVVGDGLAVEVELAPDGSGVGGVDDAPGAVDEAAGDVGDSGGRDARVSTGCSGSYGVLAGRGLIDEVISDRVDRDAGSMVTGTERFGCAGGPATGSSWRSGCGSR